MVVLKVMIYVLTAWCVASGISVSTPLSPTYLAGVVEYHLTANGCLDTNLENYLTIIEDLRDVELDILVFPENGLIGNLDLPNKKSLESVASIVLLNKNPCIDTSFNFSKVLRQLSCAAQNNNIYLVVNLAEKEPCVYSYTPDKMYFYNTNVVFDRHGMILARYRKKNLFGEFLFDEPYHNIVTTFQTDFGVTFGTFTCFDILFSSPALNLTREENITDIIFPTRWMSELPYLTALQVQQGWAYSNQVNLLASNINQPEIGSSGSGIFQIDPSRNLMHVTGKPETKVILVEVVKSGRRAEYFGPTMQKVLTFDMDVNGKLMERGRSVKPDLNELDAIHTVPYDLEDYTTLPLSSDGHQSWRLCNHGLCCNVNLTISSRARESRKDVYQYRFVVFNGIRSFSGMANGGIATCGIVACLDHAVQSCAKRFTKYSNVDWPITFEAIDILGEFNESLSTIYFPNSLTSAFIPLPKSDWIYERKNDKLVQFSLLIPQQELLTFDIYGRNFTEGSTAGRNFSYFMAILIIVLILQC